MMKSIYVLVSIMTSTYEGDTVVLLHSNNKKVYRGTQIKVRLLSDPVYQAIIPNLLSAV